MLSDNYLNVCREKRDRDMVLCRGKEWAIWSAVIASEAPRLVFGGD